MSAEFRESLAPIIRDNLANCPSVATQLFESKSGHLMPNDSTSSSESLVHGVSPHVSLGPSAVGDGRTTRSSTEPPTPVTGEPRGSHSDGQSRLESQLVDQTKQQIRSLVQEIGELSQSDCTTEDFFAGF